MSAQSESQIIQKFRESIDQGNFPPDMKVTFRVSGGMPSQRLEEELILSGRGKAEAKAMDMLTSNPPKSISTDLNKAEILEAFQKIGSGLDRMVTRSEARFLPDSVIGMVIIEIGGEKVTLYFPVEENGRAAKRESLSSPLSDTIQYFRKTTKRLIEKEDVK